MDPGVLEVRDKLSPRPPPTLPKVAGDVVDTMVDGVQILEMSAARSALNPSLLYVTLEFSDSTAESERVYIMVDNQAAGVVRAQPGGSALYEVSGVSSGEHLVEILAPDGSVIASATIVAAARSHFQQEPASLPVAAIIAVLVMLVLLAKAIRAHRASRQSPTAGDETDSPPPDYLEEQDEEDGIDSLALR